jgi:alanyl-tRNA synthetase
MVQFKDIFLGKETVDFKTATTSQKCVRAGGKHNDLENVGYTKRHLTFFEMLGNFSFGDYFKEAAIAYAWEFLTKEMKLEKDKLYITVYHTDEEAFKLWKKLTGFADEKIIKISTHDNFWMMGDTGPCGPSSEIFYDQGPSLKGGLPGTPEQDGDRFIEIWNLVFMQFEKLASGEMKELSKKSIDTGMGLERIAAVMQKVYDNFEIDLFKTIISASEEISGTKANGSLAISHRVIADHLRSSSFLIAEGITPSNEGRGYVLRRIIRRAIRHINKLGYNDLMLQKLFPTLVGEMGMVYPELEKQKEFIKSVLQSEEESFRTTIESGLKLLEGEVEKLQSGTLFPGKSAFKLHDTYGFPVDLTIDILKEKGLELDLIEFDQAMQKQKAQSSWSGSGEKAVEALWFDIKTKAGDIDFVGYETLEAKATVKALVRDGLQINHINNGEEFYLITNQTPFFGESGGQAGDIGTIYKDDGSASLSVTDTVLPIANLIAHKCKMIRGDIKVGDVVTLAVDRHHRDDVRKNHTATHLLHAALRKKLGPSVVQKGSAVRHDRFRFDFNYHKAISRDILDEIEREINELITNNLEVRTKVMSYEESLKTDTIGLFGEKYEKDVRVVYVGEDDENIAQHSSELCKGTHVDRLGDIGLIKITSEATIAAGIRRIEAATGSFAFKALQRSFNELKSIAELTKAEEGKALTKVESLLEAQKKLSKDLSSFKQKELALVIKSANPEAINNINLISLDVSEFETASLRTSAQQFLNESQSSVLLLFQITQGTLFCFVGVSSNLHKNLGADTIFKALAETFNAKGGGNNFMAQGSLAYEKEIKDKIRSKVKELLSLLN